MGMNELIKIQKPFKVCSGFSSKVVIYIKTFIKIDSCTASISWLNFAYLSSGGPVPYEKYSSTIVP